MTELKTRSITKLKAMTRFVLGLVQQLATHCTSLDAKNLDLEMQLHSSTAVIIFFSNAKSLDLEVELRGKRKTFFECD
jgi:uncharacterized protein YheU (UPF0270 family)